MAVPLRPTETGVRKVFPETDEFVLCNRLRFNHGAACTARERKH